MPNFINRPIGRTDGRQFNIPISNEDRNLIVFQPEENAPVSGGMDSFNDATNVSLSRFINLSNVTNRNAFLSRRAGSSTITPAKPNSFKVMSFYATTLFDGSVIQIRVTPTTIYRKEAGVWIVFDYNGIPFSGGDLDRFTIITTNNRVFATNNGINEIRELDLVNKKILLLGNAPKYKYITVAANRIIGANLNPSNPIQVGWSGDLNFSEWDPLVDVSAGNVSLIDSQTNYSEIITGLFGFESKLLVIRQQSLVIGVLQPSATEPFYFYTAVPGIGCDSPNTIQKVPNGVIFYDSRTKRVYKYDVSGQIDENLGILVNNVISQQVNDPNALFSSYDSINHEYQLCIPQTGSTNIKVWTYNEITKGWSYDEINNISAVNNVDFAQASITIGELVGTIADLVGTINDLSPTIFSSSRFYSTNSGDIWMYSSTLDTDNGNTYTTIIESKLFELPMDDAYFQRVRLEIIVRLATTITISYSKDNGITYTTLKSITLSSSINRQLITATKHIKARQLKWKLTCTSGLWDIVNYEVHAIRGKPSRH